jgi:hypothetical protein
MKVFSLSFCFCFGSIGRIGPYFHSTGADLLAMEVVDGVVDTMSIMPNEFVPLLPDLYRETMHPYDLTRNLIMILMMILMTMKQ